MPLNDDLDITDESVEDDEESYTDEEAMDDWSGNKDKSKKGGRRSDVEDMYDEDEESFFDDLDMGDED